MKLHYLRGLGVPETELNTQLNIVRQSVNRRSMSVMVEGNGQGVSWRMCV